MRFVITLLAWGKDLGFHNVNDLYHYFLLDPEMSGCARTSRIVQATLSCQKYVQRVLMGLEKGGDDKFVAKIREAAIPEWEWRKNYRVWEANRKVFLYPENYIEPEFRDNKTPIFKALEEELLQEEISLDAAEQAYKVYLRKFSEVGNLVIAGVYYFESE